MKTINSTFMKIGVIQFLVFLLFLASPVSKLTAQATSSNNDALTRKVEIVEDILAKILFEKGPGSRNSFIWNSNKIESVLRDNGVVFTVNKIEALSDIVIVDGIKSINVNKSDNKSTITLGMRENEKEKVVASKNSPKQTTLEEIQPKIEDFFADYAILLRELKDDAIVTILVQNNKPRYVFKTNSNSTIFGFGTASFKADNDKDDSNKELHASVKMKDVRDYSLGKIDRKQFNETINFNISLPKETPTDITIFNNIFETLYSQTNTQNYFISEAITYSDLGAIGYRFTLELYSAYKEGEKFRIIAKRDEPNVSQLEKDQFVLDVYPEWKESFLTNLIDYAITIKSFQSDRAINFEIQLPSCPSFDEKMPDQLSISFNANYLEDYRAGKLSIDKLKNSIRFKELENK